TPAFSTLSLHDALPISFLYKLTRPQRRDRLNTMIKDITLDGGVFLRAATMIHFRLHRRGHLGIPFNRRGCFCGRDLIRTRRGRRSEEHTSELQSRENLV